MASATEKTKRLLEIHRLPPAPPLHGLAARRIEKDRRWLERRSPTGEDIANMSQTSTDTIQQGTPGPWHSEHDVINDIAYVVAGKYRLAELRAGLETPGVEADTRLISAAPELLAAARMLVEWADGIIQGSVQAPVVAARQAIAKATGVQP